VALLSHFPDGRAYRDPSLSLPLGWGFHLSRTSDSYASSPKLSLALVGHRVPGGYRVDDASGNRLGYFYFWDDPAGRYHADMLSSEEAKRMAEDFAILPLRL
jgi:hypothetical protein